MILGHLGPRPSLLASSSRVSRCDLGLGLDIGWSDVRYLKLTARPWETILSFSEGLFSGAIYVTFREGNFLNLHGNLRGQPPPMPPGPQEIAGLIKGLLTTMKP